MYNENLRKFVKTKGLNNKEFAEIMGESATMIGRYLSGTAKFNSEFVSKLLEKFPEINLNEIFESESKSLDMINEPNEDYNSELKDVLNDISDIEKKLISIKSKLAR